MSNSQQINAMLYSGASLKTPCYVLDEAQLARSTEAIVALTKTLGIKCLFPLKCFSLGEGLRIIAKYVDGFSVSSSYELRLAREIMPGGFIHYTSPALVESDKGEILKTADCVSFNSINQLTKGLNKDRNKYSSGLRINPQTSFINDDKYDPCRANSKLGVSLGELDVVLKNNKTILENINGILIHNNCESLNLIQLEETVEKVFSNISYKLRALKWVNLGGGYLYNEIKDIKPLKRSVEKIKKHTKNAEIYIEPGKAIVNNSGNIIATVMDIFKSDGKNIAILDTTINHMAEVFEYQYEPDVLDTKDNYLHTYTLAGCSCLAGDVFGEYSFEEPLEIGSKIVFENMGAYTLVKANMFNGINLPTIYTYSEGAGLKLIKEYTYDDFLMLSGDNSNVSS